MSVCFVVSIGLLSGGRERGAGGGEGGGEGGADESEPSVSASC